MAELHGHMPPHLCQRLMTLRSATKTLLTLALGLPVVQAVLIWVAGLLTSMGDEAGATIIRHVGTGCQVVWSVCTRGPGDRPRHL